MVTTLEFEVLSLRHADSFYWLESRQFQEPENAHVWRNSGLGISRMFDFGHHHPKLERLKEAGARIARKVCYESLVNTN